MRKWRKNELKGFDSEILPVETNEEHEQIAGPLFILCYKG